MMPFAKVFPTLLLFVAIQPESARASEPPPIPAEDSKTVDAVRRAAAIAEVHGIGIYGPDSHGFDRADVTSWPKLVELLRRGEGPAGRIWELLPKEQRGVISDDKVVALLNVREPSAPEARGLMADVLSEIRKMLPRPDFYTEKAFKDVPLDKNLKDAVALGQKRTHFQTLHLNRALLATAFPGSISPVPVDYHIVRVLVKPGKPVILVLTSYRACQWHIEVEKGGEVVGIILGGSSPQEIAGVKAPVVYRASSDPYLKARWGRGEETIWTSYNRNDKSFIQLEAGVKKITDKTFTEFQGKSEAPKEGFVVKPSAK